MASWFVITIFVLASVLQLDIAGSGQVASELVSTVSLASMLVLAVPLADGLVEEWQWQVS